MGLRKACTNEGKQHPYVVGPRGVGRAESHPTSERMRQSSLSSRTGQEQGPPDGKIPYGHNQETRALVTKAGAHPPITTELRWAQHSPPAAASTMRGAL